MNLLNLQKTDLKKFIYRQSQLSSWASIYVDSGKLLILQYKISWLFLIQDFLWGSTLTQIQGSPLKLLHPWKVFRYKGFLHGIRIE